MTRLRDRTLNRDDCRQLAVGVFQRRLLSEAVAFFEARYPGAVQVEFDAVTSACVRETGVVFVGKYREFLKPSLASARRQDFDDSRRLVCRIPHGVLYVARLEGPLASASAPNLVSHEDADLAGLHSHPNVIAVHVSRDQNPGRESLSDHGQYAVCVLRTHLHLDLKGTGELRARPRNYHIR